MHRSFHSVLMYKSQNTIVYPSGIAALISPWRTLVKGLSSVESVTYGQQLLAKKFKTKIAGV